MEERGEAKVADEMVKFLLDLTSSEAKRNQYQLPAKRLECPLEYWSSSAVASLIRQNTRSIFEQVKSHLSDDIQQEGPLANLGNWGESFFKNLGAQLLVLLERVRITKLEFEEIVLSYEKPELGIKFSPTKLPITYEPITAEEKEEYLKNEDEVIETISSVIRGEK